MSSAARIGLVREWKGRTEGGVGVRGRGGEGGRLGEEKTGFGDLLFAVTKRSRRFPASAAAGE